MGFYQALNIAKLMRSEAHTARNGHVMQPGVPWTGVYKTTGVMFTNVGVLYLLLVSFISSFISLAVTSSQRDLHRQVCAHAGRTKIKKPCHTNRQGFYRLSPRFAGAKNLAELDDHSTVDGDGMCSNQVNHRIGTINAVTGEVFNSINVCIRATDTNQNQVSCGL